MTQHLVWKRLAEKTKLWFSWLQRYCSFSFKCFFRQRWRTAARFRIPTMRIHSLWLPVLGLHGDRDEQLRPLGSQHADVDRSGSRHIYYHQFRILEKPHKLCAIYRTWLNWKELKSPVSSLRIWLNWKELKCPLSPWICFILPADVLPQPDVSKIRRVTYYTMCS